MRYTKGYFYWHFSKAYIYPVIGLAFLTIFVNLLTLFMPVMLKYAVDYVFFQKKYELLSLFFYVFVGVIIARSTVEYVKECRLAAVVEKILCDIRQKIFSHFSFLPLSHLTRMPLGEVVSRVISDTLALKRFLVMLIGDSLSSLMHCFVVFAIAITVSRKLALVSLFFFPLFALVYIRLIRQLRVLARVVRRETATVSSRVAEAFQGIRVIKGYDLHRFEDDRFLKVQNSLLNAVILNEKHKNLIWVISQGTSALGLVVLFYVGAQEVITESISVSNLLMLYTYMGMVFVPFVRLLCIHDSYHEAGASVERICSLLNESSDISVACDASFLNPIRGKICFNDVSFAYDVARDYVLRDISFVVEPGEVVSVVGKSGAGKTSLINLLLRFYDPLSGQITIDGHDICEIDVGAFRRQVAFVLQDDFLFTGTVRENITYGLENIDDLQIMEAARQAHAHSFIMDLPDGYNTLVGEDGCLLSGGQRQRISIARAILRKPRIMILDEATSAIDYETEHEIQCALQDLIHNQTTIVITHRPFFLSQSDKVIFIENGSIAAIGSHEGLMRQNSEYKDFFYSQFCYN